MNLFIKVILCYSAYSVALMFLSSVYFKAWCSGYNAGKEDYER